MNHLKLELSKTALVVIDLQEGISSAKREDLAPFSAKEVIAQNERLTKRLKNTEALIVLVRVKNYGAERLSPLTDHLPQTNGFPPKNFSDLLLEVAHDEEAENVIVVNKHNWGAFYGTDLELQLRRRGIENIILTGVATAYGVDTTAREAFQRGFNQVIVKDAITDFDGELHTQIVEKMFPQFARVRTTDEVLEKLL
ncbi:Nicotinamidase-related amidase [Pilibacter termitis]|uniref:Nicotinamidase-related amidase n=2 Tax=Pilibacter termitis TaxID=263852 RepID=A0A1T4Q851_9ENTE|nr:Nicotinamidase-related amidase [Pilibacter termitis]